MSDERHELRRLREIVRDLAACDPVVVLGVAHRECALCWPARPLGGDEWRHAPTCPWLRAKAPPITDD